LRLGGDGWWGNDVNEKCDCNACENVLDELISLDGTKGEIPNLVDKMHLYGNNVVYVLYPKLPQDTKFRSGQCNDEFIQLTSRINQFALNTDNFWLVSADDVVPEGDASFFLDDKIHPSVKATQVIGQYVAQRILDNILVY
jgi:acyl-CoA thioesterase-1